MRYVTTDVVFKAGSTTPKCPQTEREFVYTPSFGSISRLQIVLKRDFTSLQKRYAHISGHAESAANCVAAD